MADLASLTLRTFARPSALSATPRPEVVARPEAGARPEAFEGAFPLAERQVMLLVHRQMFALAGPGPDLDDLIQTALEQLLSAPFEGRSSFKTFCHAVCYRVWLKHLRSRYRFMKRFFVTDTVPEFADEQMNADASLEERERMRRLYQALDRITPKRRAVLTLFEFSGLSTAEIAQIVEAPEPTVRTRLRDARRQLKDQLDRDGYFGEGRLGSPAARAEADNGSD